MKTITKHYLNPDGISHSVIPQNKLSYNKWQEQIRKEAEALRNTGNAGITTGGELTHPSVVFFEDEILNIHHKQLSK